MLRHIIVMTRFQSIFIAALCFAMPVVAYSRDYHIRAAAVDSVGQPESFVTWRIFALPDTIRPVRGAVTDDSGIVSAVLDKPGDYRMDLVGMETRGVSRIFSFAEDSTDIDLGEILLSPAQNQLSEITVTAQRPLVVKEIDRIGYDVKADAEAPTSTLSEILRKVPMVTVEDDGTIRVNGQTDFKIYKNGRPNSAFTNNAKDIFKAIPASSIKKIEVITDPGAREDAEGVGSILNIVTDSESTLKGVTGSISVGVSTNNYVPSPNGYISTQVGKLTVSANGGYYSYNKRSSESRSETNGTYQSTGNQLYSSSYNTGKGHGGYGGLEASFDLDTLNLFTLEANFYKNGSESFSDGENSLSGADGNTVYRFLSNSHSPMSSFTMYSGSFNYQRSTRKKGETITLSYQASGNRSTSDSETRYTELVNPPMDYTGINSNSKLNFIEHTVQLDWMRPLTERMKLDVGGKFIRRNNHSKSSRSYLGTSRDTKDDFVHRTTIGAFYADYRASFGRFDARAGLRYEFSRLAAEYRLGDERKFGSNLSDWAPNVAVDWRIDDFNTLKLSYNRRISRPGIYDLDPTVNETPTSTSQGNPDLKSSTSNSINLNYSLIKAKFNMDASLIYRSSNDQIGQIVDVVDEHMYSSRGNINHFRSYEFSLFVQWSPFSKTSVMMNLWGGYNQYKFIQEKLTKGRFTVSPYINITQRLPWKLQLRGYAFYWGGYLGSVYNYMSRPLSAMNYGLSVQRSFLKDDRLTVQIGTQNPFGPSSSVSRNYSINSDYLSETLSHSYHRQSVSLRISYRFGSLKAYVKKTAASISNDDVSSGSSSSGQQGGGGE